MELRFLTPTKPEHTPSINTKKHDPLLQLKSPPRKRKLEFQYGSPSKLNICGKKKRAKTELTRLSIPRDVFQMKGTWLSHFITNLQVITTLCVGRG